MKAMIQMEMVLWKQYLMKQKWWFCILTLILVCFIVSEKIQADDREQTRGIAIGIYTEDDMGRQLFHALSGQKGIFRFQQFTEEEELLRQIENGSLECGYVFPEGFYENLLKGKMRRQIKLYISPASVAHKISYEVVFSHLFELLSGDILIHNLEQSSLSEEQKEEYKELLLLLNQDYLENGAVFSFEYLKTGTEQEERTAALNSLRGCIAIVIFLMSLLGLANSLDMKEISAAMSKRRAFLIQSRSLSIAIFCSIAAGGIFICLTGQAISFPKELAALFLYYIVLQLYMNLLRLFTKKAETIYAMLPVLLLGSLVFTPVFISIKTYLPNLSWVEKLFPPYYYLSLFMG